MYRQSSTMDSPKDASCPQCGCRRLIYGRGKLVCSDCAFVIGKTFNKYGAKRTVAEDGIKRDSKYEASVADELYTRKKAKDILDYDSQFKVIMPIYNVDGKKVHEVSHKVDFRVHETDGSYTLTEAKGVETTDYRFRRKLLEKIWLPEHPDHTYVVVKQNSWKR